MTSENPSTSVPSPEKQFMPNITRKKAASSSSTPCQESTIAVSPSISFKDAFMHDMEVMEPNFLPVREERLELTMNEDGPEDHMEHVIPLSSQVRGKIYEPWKSSIIVKVVGKSFNYKALFT